MPERFQTLPLANALQASQSLPEPTGAELSDEIQLVDDPDDGLALPEPDDASASDLPDDDAAWAPTPSALLRHKLANARKGLLDAEERLSRAIANDEHSLPPEEARLASRDARESANKQPLDRGRQAENDAAIAAGLAQGPMPRKQKDDAAPTSWAWWARQAWEARRAQEGKRRLERLTKDELVRQIVALRATQIPEEMLWRSYTKQGLIALLAGYLGQPSVETGSASKPLSGAAGAHRVRPGMGDRNRSD